MGEGPLARRPAVAELITEAERLTAIEDRWRELSAVGGVRQ
jgi:hypothetical protein